MRNDIGVVPFGPQNEIGGAPGRAHTATGPFAPGAVSFVVALFRAVDENGLTALVTLEPPDSIEGRLCMLAEL